LFEQEIACDQHFAGEVMVVGKTGIKARGLAFKFNTDKFDNNSI